MELADKIKQLSLNVEKQLPHIATEEATKNAFIMPFLSALGYDVFNPLEVVPEFTADVGIKKGEKVDYAIKKDNKIIILLECKHHTKNLSVEVASQLYRYFSVTEARIAIVTNGLRYMFFSDLEKENRMDSKPFFVFDIRNFNDAQITELGKITRKSFDLDNILAAAGDLKYIGAFQKILEKEFSDPSEDFIKFMISQVYEGRLTKAVIEQFDSIVKKSLSRFIADKVSNKLQSALDSTNAPEPEIIDESDIIEDNNGIITTEEEILAYNIIRAICSEVVPVQRIIMRDTKSYCGVLLDDNNRKPVCRLHFNRSQKYIGVFDENKSETRHPIENIEDIYQFAVALKLSVKALDEKGAAA